MLLCYAIVLYSYAPQPHALSIRSLPAGMLQRMHGMYVACGTISRILLLQLLLLQGIKMYIAHKCGPLTSNYKSHVDPMHECPIDSDSSKATLLRNQLIKEHS